MKNREYKLPEILGKLLSENNMTQNDLARRLKLSNEAVHKWLRFKCMPSVFSLMAIAEIFNVSVDYLIYGDNSNASTTK